jgi:hypothetical protein
MARHRFILVNGGHTARPGNRAKPVVLDIPESVREVTRDKAREFLLFALRSSGNSYPTVLCEHDTAHSPEISAMFAAADWASAEVVGEPPRNAHEAINYVRMVGAPVPELEPVIAGNTALAYRYAVEFAGAFPAGEAAMALDPLVSLNYAEAVGARFRLAEDAISEDENLASRYGLLMKKHNLWGSWTEEDLARSPVWMYQYAKDHLGGALPGNLHNLMYLKSVMDSDNRWIKKYFKAKKYRIART